MKNLNEETKQALDKLVPSYGKHKTEALSLKKIVDNENGQIKNIMAAEELEEYSTGGYTVKYKVTESDDINSDKLLEMLNSKYSALCHELGIIKTREYIDDAVLEACIYNHTVSKEFILDMDSCRETTKTAKLTFSKDKRTKE